MPAVWPGSLGDIRTNLDQVKSKRPRLSIDLSEGIQDCEDQEV